MPCSLPGLEVARVHDDASNLSCRNDLEADLKPLPIFGSLLWMSLIASHPRKAHQRIWAGFDATKSLPIDCTHNPDLQVAEGDLRGYAGGCVCCWIIPRAGRTPPRNFARDTLRLTTSRSDLGSSSSSHHGT